MRLNTYNCYKDLHLDTLVDNSIQVHFDLKHDRQHLFRIVD